MCVCCYQINKDVFLEHVLPLIESELSCGWQQCNQHTLVLVLTAAQRKLVRIDVNILILYVFFWSPNIVLLLLIFTAKFVKMTGISSNGNDNHISIIGSTVA